MCTDGVKDRLSSREVLRGGMRRADVDTRVMNRQRLQTSCECRHFFFGVMSADCTRDQDHES